MVRRHPLRRFLENNSLVIFMMVLFAAFLIGVSLTGYRHDNQQLQRHHQPPQTYTQYVASGEFIEAVFENWESEFLQMAALVIGTIYLRQRGSADSKKMRGGGDVDTSSRYSIIKAASWSGRAKAVKRAIYSSSLGLALIGLFVVSFVLHATGGVEARNEEASAHGESEISTIEYVRTSQFWFESFQNWQSEFLAVGTLLLLSVYLRQRGSPESKPVEESNRKTGH